MATITVSALDNTEIVIGATGITEIAQNVRTILSTIQGTVPLDREFGLSITFLDRPLPEAKAESTGEVIAKVEKYEPRVKAQNVSFKADTAAAMDGILYPVVRCEVLYV